MAKWQLGGAGEPPAPELEPETQADAGAPNARPTVQVQVVGPGAHRRSMHPARLAWRVVSSSVEWGLFAAIVGLVVWVFGQLTLRHYLPVNGLTAHLATIATWEGHVVVGWFGPGHAVAKTVVEKKG